VHVRQGPIFACSDETYWTPTTAVIIERFSAPNCEYLASELLGSPAWCEKNDEPFFGANFRWHRMICQDRLGTDISGKTQPHKMRRRFLLHAALTPRYLREKASRLPALRPALSSGCRPCTAALTAASAPPLKALVRKTRFWCHSYRIDKRSFCQDRLGTGSGRAYR
jgi:hypothetical protein